MDFAIAADHRMKINESEKIAEYFFHFARELKNCGHEGDANTNRPQELGK